MVEVVVEDSSNSSSTVATGAVELVVLTDSLLWGELAGVTVLVAGVRVDVGVDEAVAGTGTVVTGVVKVAVEVGVEVGARVWVGVVVPVGVEVDVGVELGVLSGADEGAGAGLLAEVGQAPVAVDTISDQGVVILSPFLPCTLNDMISPQERPVKLCEDVEIQPELELLDKFSAKYQLASPLQEISIRL